MSHSPPLLEIRNLSVEIVKTGHPVLRGVSLRVQSGEMLGIVGESRSGKSVLGLAILGVLPKALRVTEGSIIFRGENLLVKGGSELNRIRGKELAMIMAGGRSALNPLETVGTQIHNVIKSHLPVEDQEARRLALEILRAVGIPDPEQRLRAYPHELSGGMAQRILIAQAMVCDPLLLVADEPTSDLDVTVAAQVLDQMKSLIERKGAATVLLTRDLGIVAQYCDTVAVLQEGAIVEYASVTSFFRQAYHPYSQALLSASFRARAYEGTKGETSPSLTAQGAGDPAEAPRLTDLGTLLGPPEYIQLDGDHVIKKF